MPYFQIAYERVLSEFLNCIVQANSEAEARKAMCVVRQDEEQSPGTRIIGLGGRLSDQAFLIQSEDDLSDRVWSYGSERSWDLGRAAKPVSREELMRIDLLPLFETPEAPDVLARLAACARRLPPPVDDERGLCTAVAKYIIASVADFDTFISLCRMERNQRMAMEDGSLSDDWETVVDELTDEMECDQLVKIAATSEDCQEKKHADVEEYFSGDDSAIGKGMITLSGLAEACIRSAARDVLCPAPDVSSESAR